MTVQPESKWQLPLAVLVVWLGLTACQSAPERRVDTAPNGSVSASTKVADVTAASDGPLTDAAGRYWALTVSGRLTYAQALSYCRNLPAMDGGSPWRLPDFYQLARAPLANVALPEGARLWTNSAPDRLPLARLVIDPGAPFVKTGVDLRTSPRFYALCVALP